MKNHFTRLTLAGTVLGLLAVPSLVLAQSRNVTPPSFDVTPRFGDVTPRAGNGYNVSPIPPPTFRQREEPSGIVKRSGRRPVYIPPQYYYNYGYGYGYWPYYAPSYGPYGYWGFPQSTYRVYR